jgi:4-hydroxybenzoyl-CoA reductase subunit beta
MEYLPEFRVHRPATVAEAVALRARETDSAYLSGGTDMVVNIRRGIERPAALIDLTAVADLNRIWSDATGLHIGAAMPLADVAAHADVRRDYGAVADAAGEIAGPTHRAYGTVGGNLCLDTRCIYYNQSEWWRESNNYCLKHRGDVCHVAPGGTRCWAAFSGDLAPALLVHDATVELVGPEGARTIGLAALYRDDGMDHLTLKPGELLSTVHVPKPAIRLPSAYAKSRIRGSIDFPLAGVAVALRMANGMVAELRVAVTAVNPYPHRIEGTDALLGKPMDEAALDRLREMVRTQSRPMHTTTTAPWYRRRVVGALARRLAAQLSR